MPHRVLVVDDEENLRLVLETLLKRHGYEVLTAATGEEALACVESFDPDFLLADIRMPGMTGLALCEALQARRSRATVIVMSAYGTVDLALEAMKAGAYDYVSKPFKQDEVLLVLKKAAEREGLRRENRALRQAARARHQLGGLLGKSAAMQALFETIEKAAGHKTTTLIVGESGTGKELVAKTLHALSDRKDGPFVAVNCGAIPANLLESELFGYRRGAFTGATADKIGLFQRAEGGTLFLDEVGELPLPLQSKFLRVVQEGTVRPLGSTEDLSVDVRLLAATVRDLRQEVARGAFREDLLYRLNVLTIEVPPLRDRREDVPLLIEQILERLADKVGAPSLALEDAALRLLSGHDWPGNIRQLENVLERAAVLHDDTRLAPEDFPDVLRQSQPPGANDDELSIKKRSRHLEARLIRKALKKTGGNRSAAAKLLEISHKALLYKIKDYKIDA